MTFPDRVRRALLPVVGGVLATLPAPAATQAPAPPPVFGVRVEAVYNDAFVTRGGRPVAGLAASDFEVKDNGILQRAELVGVDSLPLQSVLVFDTSGSVVGEKLAALQGAGRAFLEGLRPGDEAGLLAFSEEIRWHARPTTDRAALRRALEGLRGAGATAVRDALYAGLTLPKTQARILVVLFTDGEDNMSWLSEGQLRAAAERSNALVQVVGVRRDVARPYDGTGQPLPEPDHERALRQIAERTGGRFWEAESPARLSEAFSAIIEAMNSRYVLRYEPQGERRAGWHRIDLRLRGARGDVRSRRGYWVGGR